jgi:3-hydroxyisobutyrate dehydrogenase-like beta-hydroxyacid dehydrogenase
MRICILGMGQMGQAFAARALETGHQVTVWNRSGGRADDLVARGAREAESAKAAVAGADAVLVVLADDAAVVDVCMGPDGALGALEPGAVLANISTVAPDTARQMADAGPDSRVLDAPVMGSPLMISSGLGQFLIGGPIDAVTAIGPVWEDLGSGYVHCGPAGSGATIKVISNLLLITGVAALAEGIATARGHGISDDLLRSLIGDSLVVSPATKLRLDSVLDSEHPGWFSPALARKDLRLALDLAGKAGIAVRVGPAIDVLLTSVIDDGRNWPDFAAIIEALS